MRKLLYTLSILAAFTAKALAFDFQSENLLYTIINANPPQVSLDGHVNGQDAQGELVIPETVEHDGVTYTVTEIGNNAFFACIHLTGDLVIPQTVTRIGSRAFQACGCDGNLTIPNSVTEIGRYAFCINRLTGQLVLPRSIQKIEAGAFAGSEGFTGDLVIPESVTMICDSAFRLCSFDGILSIGSAVETIGVRAFCQCSGLKGSLIIPESVIEIGHDAFYYCSGFDGCLVLPSHLDRIEDMSFVGCEGLVGSLLLPEGLSYIGYMAFCFCGGLTGELVIPHTVRIIEEGAFSDTGFSHLTIGGGVESIRQTAFASMPLSSIKIHADIPPALHYLSFANVPKSIPVYIPCNTLELYQEADYWEEFECFIEDCSLSANENEGVTPITCYPNPTTNFVRLVGSNITVVQVFNPLGQLVKTVQNMNEISMLGWAKGEYVLHITDAEGHKCVKKVMKE